MTIAEAKSKLVAWCNGQLGYVESGDNWNKYAQGKYAAYGWDVQNQPWCDVFVDCGFIECFGLEAASQLTYQPKGGFSALCSTSANYYKANGAWYLSPEVGDQVFFNVSGGINHTGIVVAVSGGVVTTVEGNSSDTVRRNAYGTGSSYIAGYGRPNWSIFSGNLPSTPTTGENTQSEKTAIRKTTEIPTLKRGDKGEVVRAAQILLNGRHCSVGIWGADGDFGNATFQAVTAFQRRNELEPDGVVGPQTWAALLGV